MAETAAEGIAALHIHADTWRPAPVDLFLKDGNGLEVLRAGQERRRDQHMLVLTNYATPEIRRRSTLRRLNGRRSELVIASTAATEYLDCFLFNAAR